MSEGEGPRQQRYCTNCGTEIRSGTKFCVSCGASLVQEQAGSGPAYSVPPPGPQQPPVDTLRESLERLGHRFTVISNKVRGANLGDAPARIINWFRDLPSVPKLVIVGLILLLILTVLSPLALVVATLVLGVSVIALIVRLAQRRSIRGWGIAAVVSLASLFVFGAISDGIYSTGFFVNADSSDDMTGNELLYLVTIEEGAPSLDNRSDEELLGYGYDVCQLLEGGDDPEVVFDKMYSNTPDAYGDYEVGYVMRTGVEAFCPEYSSSLDYWDGSASDASASPGASASTSASASPSASVPSSSSATGSASPASSETEDCSLVESIFGKRDDGVFDIKDDNNCNGTPDYREDYDNDGQINLLDDDDYDGTADYLE